MNLGFHSLRGYRRDDVDVGDHLVAVDFQREVVDVFAEGVLDFVADVEHTEDDVGGYYGYRYAQPSRDGGQLERKCDDVDPANLADGDLIGKRQRRVQNSVSGCKHSVKIVYTVHSLHLRDSQSERPQIKLLCQICRKMG